MTLSEEYAIYIIKLVCGLWLSVSFLGEHSELLIQSQWNYVYSKHLESAIDEPHQQFPCMH